MTKKLLVSQTVALSVGHQLKAVRWLEIGFRSTNRGSTFKVHILVGWDPPHLQLKVLHEISCSILSGPV